MFDVYSKLIEDECKRLGFNTNRTGKMEFYCNGVYFYKTSSSTPEARKICRDKIATKELFKLAGVPTPEWQVIKKHSFKGRLSIPFPVVIKPFDGSLSRGVTVNVENRYELLAALDIAFRKGKKKAMAEKFLTGEYYRVFATTEKLVSIVHYARPVVIGDGKSTIGELAVRRTEVLFNMFEDKLHETVLARTRVSRDRLDKLGLKPNTILPEGVELVISDFPNRSFGSIGEEVIESVDLDEFMVCVNAVRAIPGLNSSSMDVMRDTETGELNIIELNGTPHLRGNMWPLLGPRQPVIEEFVKISLGL